MFWRACACTVWKTVGENWSTGRRPMAGRHKRMYVMGFVCDVGDELCGANFRMMTVILTLWRH